MSETETLRDFYRDVTGWRPAPIRCRANGDNAGLRYNELGGLSDG